MSDLPGESQMFAELVALVLQSLAVTSELECTLATLAQQTAGTEHVALRPIR